VPPDGNTGPLAGVRVLELAGLGALPYGSLRLADMGAEVVRVERPADVPDEPEARGSSSWDRGRRSIAVDLKSPEGVDVVLRLVEGADAFLEAFRPGVAERLGVGPDEVLARNPRIVYGRLTGWGQDGPLAQQAGHSLNYEAITGVVHAIGRPEVPPSTLLQLLGDFGGGGLSLAYGVVCALLEVERSGRGQVVDTAMVDGVASLASVFYSMAESGFHAPDRGTNLFDGGAPFYAVYECADGRWLSVAPIEPHFYALLLDGLGLAGEDLPGQNDRNRWPELRARIAEVVRTRTRDEWVEVFAGTDACVAPVLDFTEARSHPQMAARVFPDGGTAVPPVPKLSVTPGRPGPSPAWPGADTDLVLTQAGFTSGEIAALRDGGVIR
jgi:alpha-methylacyl-CoA racemase